MIPPTWGRLQRGLRSPPPWNIPMNSSRDIAYDRLGELDKICLEKFYIKRTKRCSDIRSANSYWNHLVDLVVLVLLSSINRPLGNQINRPEGQQSNYGLHYDVGPEHLPHGISADDSQESYQGKQNAVHRN